MGEIRLFHQVYGQVFCLENNPFPLEDPLHVQIEHHLLDYLGVHFLARKVEVGAVELDSDEKGQIDTLGIDIKNRPVIIEYKKGKDQGVVPQALDYRDWLLKNKAMFRELVRESSIKLAEKVAWRPRLIIVAGEITPRNKRDAKRNKDNTIIELVRYRRFGEDFLTLEWEFGSDDTLLLRNQDTARLGKQQHSAGKGETEALLDNLQSEKKSNQHIDFNRYENWDKVSDSVRELFHNLHVGVKSSTGVRTDVFDSQISFRYVTGEETSDFPPTVFAEVRFTQTDGLRVQIRDSHLGNLKRDNSFARPIRKGAKRELAIRNSEDVKEAKIYLSTAWNHFHVGVQRGED